jgi:lipopolysaccharide transport system permease protein
MGLSPVARHSFGRSARIKYFASLPNVAKFPAMEAEGALRQQIDKKGLLVPSPGAVQVIFRNWGLIRHLSYREIFGRYLGTYLGILWSVATPLVMLAVYTLVFGGIFQGRFGAGKSESPVDFALGLFCGLNLYSFFSEVLQKSPALILDHPNYVKKVVFPLEILPVVTVLASLFHLAIASLLLVIGIAIAHHSFSFSFLYLIPFVIPLVLATLGLSWLFSAIGVFIRDLQSAIPPVLTVLMFLSGVFYSISAVPPAVRPFIKVNPMAQLIESTRDAVVWGIAPNWYIVLGLYVLGLFIFFLGYWIFRLSKTAFADAL